MTNGKAAETSRLATIRRDEIVTWARARLKKIEYWASESAAGERKALRAILEMVDGGESAVRADPIVVSVEDAVTIRNAFLPRNPNKMRGAAPEVVEAATRFIEAVVVAVNVATGAR